MMNAPCQYVFLLCLISLSSFGQNLVQNGGFEDHDPIECLSCYTTTSRFNKLLVGWKDVGGYAIICDSTYKKQGMEETTLRCEFKDVSPVEGKTMMEMIYFPNLFSRDFSEQGLGGCLGTSLTKKLKVGHNYKVSFWINIYKANTPEFVDFIGFSLFPKKISNRADRLLYQNKFLLDTIIYNQWYKVSWVVQPLCELEFLVIGVFKNDKRPPANELFSYNIFYIDQVEVVEVDPSKNAIRYCKASASEEQSDLLLNFVCHFDIGSSGIRSSDFSLLDSIALKMKDDHRLTFTLKGFTDNTGNDNLNLSKNRVESVLKYFTQIYKIPATRFILESLGESTSNNDSNEGRAQNRRVEITSTGFSLQQVLYRHFLETIALKDYKSAMKQLMIWFQFADDNEKLAMLYDSRINSFKQGKKWDFIIKKVKDSYSKYGTNQNLAFALDSLWIENRNCRTLHNAISDLATIGVDFDENKFEIIVNTLSTCHYNPDQDECPCSKLDFINKSDVLNFKKIVELIGVKQMKESEFGTRITEGNFLIFQYCKDIEVQKEFLNILKKKCNTGEAKWIYYAKLYDKILIEQDLPQRFGTQFNIKDEVYEYFPFENKDSVNIWRSQIGLDDLKL